MDGFLPAGGCRPPLVHLAAGGRRHAALGQVQGPPQLAIRSSPPFGTLLRARRVPPHGLRRGLCQPFPGASPPRWPHGGGTTGAALHRGPPTAVEPRRASPQPRDAQRSDELGTPSGVDGAGPPQPAPAQGCPPRASPGSGPATSPAGAPAAVGIASPGSPGPCAGPPCSPASAWRGRPGEAAFHRGAGGTSTARPLLQLQRTLLQRPQPRLSPALLPRRRGDRGGCPSRTGRDG